MSIYVSLRIPKDILYSDTMMYVPPPRKFGFGGYQKNKTHSNNKKKSRFFDALLRVQQVFKHPKVGLEMF